MFLYLTLRKNKECYYFLADNQRKSDGIR